MTETTVQEYEQRAEIWATRLPEYEQCAGGLHKENDGFCCLGVAADVSNLGFWTDSEDDADGDPLCNWVPLEYREEACGLETEDLSRSDIPTISDLMPPEVMEYYGVRTNNGNFEWFTLPAMLRWQILQELMQPRTDQSLADGEKISLLDPEFDDFRATHSLVFLNDKEVSFWLIAEVIKAQPKGLFTWA